MAFNHEFKTNFLTYYLKEKSITTLPYNQHSLRGQRNQIIVYDLQRTYIYIYIRWLNYIFLLLFFSIKYHPIHSSKKKKKHSIYDAARKVIII
jgi:hypothetical protein